MHRTALAALAAATLAAGPAAASDGAIEINQASAIAGGVTPTDAPGYPITISRAGSYRVTGHLLADAGASPIIEVTGDDVTLDLGGFAIGCPVLVGQACPGGGSADGIAASAADGLVVRNGRIVGTGGDGVSAGNRARIERVEVRIAGDAGIRVGGGSHVEACTVIDSNADGIVASASARIADNMVADNDDDGVQIASGNVLGNTIRGNGGRGVFANQRVHVADNAILENTGLAIDGPAAAYRGNLLAGNNGNLETQVGGGALDLGGNACEGDLTCP
jgi:hypothetical protein